MTAQELWTALYNAASDKGKRRLVKLANKVYGAHNVARWVR